ncbi:hypothetical protein [Thermomonospora amylolytica]|uniref:hypothetical protein n=1 Tax=Thermomonospora amylolytica TaxID=1411117 RepID=UPI001300B1BF|nr:hypothetical protein [Thermomonospora amylolytica]
MIQIGLVALLLVLLLHRRAERLMPRVREWMNFHSRVVDVAACLIFVALIL